jgi:hypothetical protein
MFSDIQNIGSASEPLKTEAVDSRLSNKNKDGENHNNKRSKNEDSVKKTLGEDINKNDITARVNNADDESVNRFSLDSLIFFLEDFLEEHMTQPTAINNETPDNEPKDISTTAPWLRSKHVNSNARKKLAPPLSSLTSKDQRNVVPPRYAAHAYAHRALSNSISQPTLQRVKKYGAYDQKTNALPSKPHKETSSENIKDIYGLIGDLREMKERGATHLEVRDNSALLEGISAAVRKNAIS